ncbi:unnamed protein product, partial [Lymnaea stagnalis]
FRLSLKSSGTNILLEMPKQDATTDFLGEIKRATDVQSHSSVFGEPTTFFTWLQKYRKQSTEYIQSLAENPFVEDTFDPLKHMNLGGTNVHVVAAESTSRQTIWFEDDISKTTLQNNHKAVAKSQSRDSLDKMILGDEDFTDAIDSMQMRLGLSPGSELPLGAKPVTSREKVVRQCLTEKEVEFTDLKTFKVFCGTWNVNGQSPAESLSKWMVVDEEPPDIYAIGFQELDLSKEAFIFSDSPKEAEWQEAVKKFLHPKAKYKKVS